MFPINLAIQDELERQEVHREQRLQMRVMRDQSDPFGLPDIRFIELFRLSKNLVTYLINQLEPWMEVRERAYGIPAQLRIFSALSFFATGTYQRPVGQSYLLAMSQQSVSRAVKEVSNAIYHHLGEEWIRFPTTEAEKINSAASFMLVAGFPATIGAIDCTHVNILTPTEEEHNYLNRKGKHSKNVQIICSSDLKILNINARGAGAMHDSFIWRNSNIHEYMERSFREGERFWLVGDSGYPQQPWLMTPILNAPPNSPEGRYTQAHIRTRNCVERCIGVLKCRFRCVMGERELRYNPSAVGVITTACAVLHNMCLTERLPDVLMDLPLEEPFQDDPAVEPLAEGNAVRAAIVANYFL